MDSERSNRNPERVDESPKPRLSSSKRKGKRHEKRPRKRSRHRFVDSDEDYDSQSSYSSSSLSSRSSLSTSNVRRRAKRKEKRSHKNSSKRSKERHHHRRDKEPSESDDNESIDTDSSREARKSTKARKRRSKTKKSKKERKSLKKRSRRTKSAPRTREEGMNPTVPSSRIDQSSEKVISQGEDLPYGGKSQASSPLPGPPISTNGNEQKEPRPQGGRNFAPMTREHYEALQSQLREEFDPQTGRMRLVRGTGEIVERIVSRTQHQAINRQATRGDGAFFHRQVISQAAGSTQQLPPSQLQSNRKPKG